MLHNVLVQASLQPCCNLLSMVTCRSAISVLRLFTSPFISAS